MGPAIADFKVVGLKNFGQRTDRPCIHTPLDRHIAEQLCNFGKNSQIHVKTIRTVVLSTEST